MQLSNLTKVLYKRLWFTVNDSFLTSNCKLDSDINYFIQCPENINGKLNEFYTLLIDLKLPTEKIWSSIYYRTQSEISSFIENQTFEYNVIQTIPNTELNHFVTLFNRFANEKGIRKAEFFRLKAYNAAGILAISYIKQNNSFVCVNIYRVTQQRATNLYSFHVKQNTGDKMTASHLGRAHRALHWLDIKTFMKDGVDFYDFCGWYSGITDKSLLNINKFKEQFTSYKIKEYSGVIYKNKLLKLLKKLR